MPNFTLIWNARYINFKNWELEPHTQITLKSNHDSFHLQQKDVSVFSEFKNKALSGILPCLLLTTNILAHPLLQLLHL